MARCRERRVVWFQPQFLRTHAYRPAEYAVGMPAIARRATAGRLYTHRRVAANKKRRRWAPAGMYDCRIYAYASFENFSKPPFSASKLKP